MKHLNLDRQRGVVLIQAVIALVVLLGMAALALDLGNAYLNKTRLQNSVDAAALAGAKALDLGAGTSNARAAATAVFEDNAQASGNTPLALGWDSGSGDITLSITFSPTLTTSFTAESEGPYVRANAQGLSLDAFFARVFGLNEFRVAASAVAGPSASLAQVCNVFPMMVCPGGSGGTPYWGYNPNLPIDLVAKGMVGPGNFGFLSLEGDTGASDLQDALAGRYEQCVTPSDGLNSKTGGNTNMAITGVNSRFEDCDSLTPKPDCTAGEDGYSIIRPDWVTDTEIAEGGPPLMYSDYEDRYADIDPATGIPGRAPFRRLIVVPVADCDPPTPGTSVNVGVEGFACLFLTDLAKKDGSDLKIQAQFVPIEDCDVQGVPGSGSGGGLSDLHQIILHNDPYTDDS